MQTQILKARAERLARILEAPDYGERVLNVLVFKLGQEKYAIETQYIKEVYPLKNYTPLPCVPSFIYGLVNIRRKILSIFDLKAFLGLKMKKSSESKLIILEDGEMEFALLTDGVYSIQNIPFSQIQLSLPTSLTEVKQDFLQGITPEKIILLNGQKLLANKQIIVNEEVEI